MAEHSATRTGAGEPAILGDDPELRQAGQPQLRERVATRCRVGCETASGRLKPVMEISCENPEDPFA